MTENKIIIINGPNLNYLGKRQPEIYGNHSLKDIENLCQGKAKDYNFNLDFRQSNHEGKIIDWLYEADKEFDLVIINPAAYSHYSIAILDAIYSISIPVIEVHLSNIKDRENFRKKSITEEACIKSFIGAGYKVYIKAIDFYFHNKKEPFKKLEGSFEF